MSTYVGGRHRPHPDSPTSTRCSWPFCDTLVTVRFQRENVLMCQEHAILIWAAVEHMRTAGTVEPKVRPLPTASEIEGCVYYIRIGDRVKIGHTTNPSKRLATYPPQTEILALRRGSKELEHREHVRFSEHRTDGREWFHANERVLHMIAEIPDVDHDWEPEWFQRRTHTPQIVEHRKAKNAKAGNGHA